MRHVIVSRFSVPRLDDRTASLHADRGWLRGRLDLFRRYFVPSVESLGVPAVLLCSSESAPYVAERTADLPWARVEVQNDWHGGWTGAPDQMVTRLDSDDAVHAGWLEAVEASPRGFEVYCSKEFLRLDPSRQRLYQRRRREPVALAAFPAGHNPYLYDHAELERRLRACILNGPYLLQVVHGGNLSNRRPGWRHFRFRVPLARLAPFGVSP